MKHFTEITDFKALSLQMQQSNKILLLIASSDNCAFCEQLKQEFLLPIFNDKKNSNKAIVAELDIGSTDSLINFSGSEVTVGYFVQRYKIIGTPTMLFLSHKGQELNANIFGIATPDYFFLTIEEAIESSYKSIQNT